MTSRSTLALAYLGFVALVSCGLPTPPLEVIDQARIAGRTDEACEKLFLLVNTDAQDDPFGNALFQLRVKATMEAFERRGVDPVAWYRHEQVFEIDPMERWRAMDDLVRFCEDWLGEPALKEEAGLGSSDSGLSLELGRFLI